MSNGESLRNRGRIDPDPEMTLNKDLELAAYAIKTNGSEAITKSVLPGTEDYLKKFIDSDGKDLPEIYQLIANQHNRTKYPPVSATDIARQQASLVGKDEIPKSEIEKQLDESPEPIVVARQILKKVYGRKSGRFYGGGFFQARIAPILGSLFFNSIIQKILKIRFSLKI